MGKIGPDARDTIPLLIEALKDEDENVRNVAAAALGEIGSDAREAVPALIEAVNDEEYPYFRSIIMEVSGQIGPDARGAVPLLIEALKGENEYVRSVAEKALKKIQGQN